MDIGNDGVKHLTGFVEFNIENTPQEEVGLHIHVLFLDQRLADVQCARDNWSWKLKMARNAKTSQKYIQTQQRI